MPSNSTIVHDGHELTIVQPAEEGLVTSPILSHFVWFIFYSCVINLFVVSKPSLWIIHKKEVEVIKRLIYYISGCVYVHVVFVFVQSV